MARTLERAALAIVRRLQRINPDYGVRPLTAGEVAAVLRKCNTRQVSVDHLPSVAVWTPPLDGENLLLVAADAPYAVARFAALRTAAQYELGDAPPIAAYAAAACGILNVQDVERKGGAFVRRKQSALASAPDAFWEGYSPVYILRIAARVLAYIAARPRSASAPQRASAQYHLDLGRVALRHRRHTSALRHFIRAEEMATAQGNAEVLVLSVLNTGNVHRAKGDLRTAAEKLHLAAERGISVARRDLAARALHDLAAVAIERGDYGAADGYLMEAAAHYPQGDHRRLILFADAAYMWMEQGHCSRALRILSALVPLIAEGPHRTQVMASMVRAASAAGERQLYERLWPEVQASADVYRTTTEGLRACVELVIAHYRAGERPRAEELARVVYRNARRTGERGIAREVKRTVRDGRAGCGLRPAAPASSADIEAFAEQIVDSLAVIR